LLYPLSYEGASHQGTCQQLSVAVSNAHRLSAATDPTGDSTPITPAAAILLDDHERNPSLSTAHRGSPTIARTSLACKKIINLISKLAGRQAGGGSDQMGADQPPGAERKRPPGDERRQPRSRNHDAAAPDLRLTKVNSVYGRALMGVSEIVTATA